MKSRMLLGMSLACIGLAAISQADAQGLGCRWGGSGYYPGAAGGSGLGYGYRYNFGGPGGYGAYVGLGYVGDPDAAYGWVQSGPLVLSNVGYRYGAYGYGRGRCGYGLSASSDSGAPKMPGTPKIPGTYPSTWRGYSPLIDVASCGMSDCASGSASQSVACSPESEPSNISTASLAQHAR